MLAPDDRALDRIAARHGIPSRPARVVTGLGSVNHVVVVGDGADRYVLRMALDPARADEFEVEEWCLRRAEQAGIPSPVVAARGDDEGRTYLLQRYVASSGPGGDDDGAWSVLATYAMRVATIDVSDAPGALFTRFGRDLPRAWAAHLDHHRDQLRGGGTWRRFAAVAPDLASRQRMLAETLDRLSAATFVHGLAHGDLHPRNLLLLADAAPVLLDWGCAATGPLGFGELVPLLRSHVLSGMPDASRLRAFAVAIGLPLDEHGRTLLDLHRLAAVDRVHWAVERRADLIPAYLSEARRLLAAPVAPV